MSHSIRASVLAVATLLAFSAHGQAQAPSSTDALRSAAQKAIAANPEVSARLNALRASSAAVDISRGGLRPKIDLEASAGRTEDRISSRTPEGESLSRSGASLSLSQILWDANVIRSDIQRAGHEQRARWFEFLDLNASAKESYRASMFWRPYCDLAWSGPDQ